MPSQQYPMLETCRVTIKSSVIDLPPVRLPSEVIDAAEQKLPPVYDFALGKQLVNSNAIEKETKQCAE